MVEYISEEIKAAFRILTLALRVSDDLPGLDILYRAASTLVGLYTGLGGRAHTGQGTGSATGEVAYAKQRRSITCPGSVKGLCECEYVRPTRTMYPYNASIVEAGLMEKC